MMFLENLRDALGSSIISTWSGVIDLVPKLVAAVVVFAVGWLIAVIFEKVVESLFKSLKVDALLKSAGLDDVMKRTGHPLNSGRFVGALIKWFVIVAFLVASLDVLGLNQVNEFLRGVVLSYLPQVIVAVLILIVAVLIADAMQKLVAASARAAHVKSAHFLGVVTKWSIWIFGALTALITLNVAAYLIQMILTAIFAGMALALGLAFGLGGKDYASGAIERAMHKLTDKE